MTTTVLIRDLDHWADIYNANRDALEETYPGMTEDDLIRKACDGGITLGGGAAPIFFFIFEG